MASGASSTCTSTTASKARVSVPNKRSFGFTIWPLTVSSPVLIHSCKRERDKPETTQPPPDRLSYLLGLLTLPLVAEFFLELAVPWFFLDLLVSLAHACRLWLNSALRAIFD